MPMYVGIDLVSADEVRESLQRHGDRYLNRVYTDSEQQACARDPRRLAACFAAKEAAMKALGLVGEPLPWRSIGVQRCTDGSLSLELSDAAADLAQQRGVSAFALSVSYHRAGAAAIVLAEG
jgi:holo-[acyl-carrier protein] synthase